MKLVAFYRIVFLWKKSWTETEVLYDNKSI